MNAIRKEHEEQMKITREKNCLLFKMEVLPHNPSFWVLYRKLGIEPKLIEFLPMANSGGEVSRTAACGETSQKVDLTLKL
jgi:hypothetical protein